jgi:endonuclease YncB( thermonuclease family)
VTPQASLGGSAPGVASQQDEPVGAFKAPAATTQRVDAKPQTAHMTVNPVAGTSSASSKPVEIPKDLPWSQPVVAVQAKQPIKGSERALVTFVQDGDGATVRKKDGSEVNCRIDTIDAPETAKPRYGKSGQAYGEEAKKTLASLIENKEVTVKVTKALDNNRFGCQIEIEGVGVDKKMLQAGAAWLYRRYANDPALAAAETEAKTVKRGLWSDPNAMNPETFRRIIERAR